MPARNLNLVILKNEIAVTRSELVECKYSRGNSRVHEHRSLVQRNPSVHTGQCAAVPTCAQTPGAVRPGPLALTSARCRRRRCWAFLGGRAGSSLLAVSLLPSSQTQPSHRPPAHPTFPDFFCHPLSPIPQPSLQLPAFLRNPCYL